MNTYVVSECGINHNGDLSLVKKLIDESKFAGANAVKFQKRDIDKVYSQEELNKYRESPFGKTNREQKLGLELRKEQYDFIDSYCKEKNIEWFASPWDLNSFKFLQQYKCPHQKLASALLGHTSLIEAMASCKKHTFISTGMSTILEIENVVNIFKRFGCGFTLMHCNSQYPMPNDDANLNCIETLRDKFECDVGYSCHSTGIIPAVLAVVLGATCIEKHITLDRSMYGSDQASSIEPMGFFRMVEYIKLAEQSLGNGIKNITDGEQKARAKLRKIKDF